MLNRAVLAALLAIKALRTPVAFGVTAILDDGEGKVLLVRHSYQPGWHLPGGGVSGGEPPAKAIVRELQEEIGLLESEPPELVGLHTRRVGLVNNVVALYRVRGARFDFKPNMEIREIRWVDPKNPPADTTIGTRRRLTEFAGQAPGSAYW